MGTGLDRVELDPQGFLFFPLAVVPRAPLKPHHQNIVPDEVGALTILQQSLIGRIGTKIAQLNEEKGTDLKEADFPEFKNVLRKKIGDLTGSRSNYDCASCPMSL